MMIILLLVAGSATAQAPSLPAFMTGCWNFVEGDRWTQECWMEPKAGLMLGASREGSGTRVNSWEQLRIEQAADGAITLFASPGGKPALTFKAAGASTTAVEFTNARHDYPQRIRYELKGDKLEAEISLIDGSRPIRWTYVRERRSTSR